MRRWVPMLLAAALAAPGAYAQGDSPRLTPLLGEPYRYPNLWLPLRFAADLVAIPASMPRWEQQDFALFAMYAGVVGALMTPTPTLSGLSPDTRLQRFIRGDQPRTQAIIWTPTGDPLVWAGLWAGTASLLAYGWFAPDPSYLEVVSLMLEAFALSEVSQVGIKFVLGREGPRDGDGLGLFYGPEGFFRLFPAGTPSGHVAALYAMMGVLSAYWQNPVLDVALHLFGLAFSVTIVTDNYHFISDVVWGAAMGYYQGRWVVRNRSTHYRFEPSGKLVPAAVVPIVEPRSGTYGLSLAWTF